jgi:alpha-1,2-mannosyltransferase
MVFTTEVVHTTVYFGQSNLVLLGAVLWDLLRFDTRWSKGVILGFAADVKLPPLFFVLYLVATKGVSRAADDPQVYRPGCYWQQ